PGLATGCGRRWSSSSTAPDEGLAPGPWPLPSPSDVVTREPFSPFPHHAPSQCFNRDRSLPIWDGSSTNGVPAGRWLPGSVETLMGAEAGDLPDSDGVQALGEPPTDGVSLVRAVDVFKIYREGTAETVALRGASLELPRGRITALVGR